MDTEYQNSLTYYTPVILTTFLHSLKLVLANLDTRLTIQALSPSDYR